MDSPLAFLFNCVMPQVLQWTIHNSVVSVWHMEMVRCPIRNDTPCPRTEAGDRSPHTASCNCLPATGATTACAAEEADISQPESEPEGGECDHGERATIGEALTSSTITKRTCTDSNLCNF